MRLISFMNFKENFMPPPSLGHDTDHGCRSKPTRSSVTPLSSIAHKSIVTRGNYYFYLG